MLVINYRSQATEEFGEKKKLPSFISFCQLLVAKNCFPVLEPQSTDTTVIQEPLSTHRDETLFEECYLKLKNNITGAKPL